MINCNTQIDEQIDEQIDRDYKDIIFSRYVKILFAKTKKTNPKIKQKVKRPTKKHKKFIPSDVFKHKPNKYINPTKKAPKSRNKPISRRFKIKPTGMWLRQDESLPAFQELLEQGYNMVTFVAHPSACNFCKKMNGKTWSLINFINSTQFEAPIFSHSHVNSASKMRVWDKTMKLPNVFVNYNGDIQ